MRASSVRIGSHIVGCTLSAMILLLCVGCKPPGKPTAADIESRPEEVRDFATLYQQNCAGCHGQGGKGNPAIPLANPVYWSIASGDTVRRVTATGVRGSLMPAFAKSAGGTLTDQQIEILVRGMRTNWATSSELLGASPPPYVAEQSGDPNRGAGTYAV